MEFYAIHIPKKTEEETESVNVFTERSEALKLLKEHKEGRFKAFKSEEEAEEFSRHGKLTQNINIQGLKSPSSLPIAAEKSVHRSLTPQQLVAFRKEIEQKNLSNVHKMVMGNPRYLVSCANTPTILKEGTRYNALHVAIISKDLNMCKLILQTVEKKEFIELLNGMPQDTLSVQEASMILLESYLNMPDKPRGETALHFAAKLGLKDIVELLISYPICKMKPNFDGNLPKDIICQRCSDTTPELIKSIEHLLVERFYVPVLRASDNSIPPIIGEPYSTLNPPNLESNPLSPTLEIKAYAGPMDEQQAKTFQRRWKTPPRLIPKPDRSDTPASKWSYDSPNSKASPLISPTKVKHNLLNNNYSSTPISHRGRRLFSDDEPDASDNKTNPFKLIEDVKNGNFKEKNTMEINEIHTTAKTEINNKAPELIERFFHEYRDDRCNDSLNDTPIQLADQSYSYYCEETNNVYNPANLLKSPGLKERLVRIADPDKGLEVIGRELAKNQSIGWKEYWKFLNAFVDLSSKEGLDMFEQFLKKKEQPSSLPKSSSNDDTIFMLCNGLDTLHLNKDETPRSKKRLNEIMKHLNQLRTPQLPTPTSHITNQYLYIEKALQTYAKRTSLSLAQNPSDSYNILEQEVKKLKNTILSYHEDTRFKAVNLKKAHSRYAHLILWYLQHGELPANVNRQQVLDILRNIKSKNEVKCIVELISDIAELEQLRKRDLNLGQNDMIVNPQAIVSEVDCINEWRHEFPCSCSIVNGGSTDARAKQQRRLRRVRDLWPREDQTECAINEDDLWNMRNTKDISDDLNSTNGSSLEDEEYYSCDSDLEFGTSDDNFDDDSENCFLTPPESPTDFASVCDNSDEFEEDEFEDIFSYTNYIEGEEISKIDLDAYKALANVTITESEYPYLFKWKEALQRLDQNDFNNIVAQNPSVVIKSPAFKSL